ncbi:cytochrome P450 734A1-like protein [Tanacetum coccineum]
MKLIEKRSKKWDDDEEMVNRPKDLLGLMIEASRKKESLLNSTSAITARDIAEECKSFFFAGEQTTSNLLTWTTVLLAMHPTWQDTARDEVLSVCGFHDIPTKDCVSKLKTLTMILNESLRLYPPIVASIRRAKADVELGGYKIPRGTELLIPILAVHHDQTIWGKDANEFNPSRFSDGVARAGKHPLAFIFVLVSAKCIWTKPCQCYKRNLTIAIDITKVLFRDVSKVSAMHPLFLCCFIRNMVRLLSSNTYGRNVPPTRINCLLVAHKNDDQGKERKHIDN